MTRINHRRGHELLDHLEAKIDGRQKMLLAAFDLVVCEYGNGDVVGKRRIDNLEYVLTLEFERTVRNISRNIIRDLSYNKSNKVLVVCLYPLKSIEVYHLLNRTLPVSDRSKVAVVNQDQFTVELLRSINTFREVDSSFFRLFQQVNSEEKSVSSGNFGKERSSGLLK